VGWKKSTISLILFLSPRPKCSRSYYYSNR